ncbi:hypothetical protein N9B68_01815 [bacterium]|nr:hypothetical protein [bacterium]
MRLHSPEKVSRYSQGIGRGGSEGIRWDEKAGVARRALKKTDSFESYGLGGQIRFLGRWVKMAVITSRLCGWHVG